MTAKSHPSTSTDEGTGSTFYVAALVKLKH
jgi:hypothetical protein